MNLFSKAATDLLMQADGEVAATDAAPLNIPGQFEPPAETTNEASTTEEGAEGTTGASAKAPRAPRAPRQRGPPEDGVPSKTKIMVANLPYDIAEEKVWSIQFFVN